MKDLCFFENELLFRLFLRILFRFFNISWDFLDLYVIRNKEYSYQRCIQGPCKLELFVTKIKKFVKSSILDVEGVSAYDDSYHQPLSAMHMGSHWWQKTVNLEIVLIDLYKKPLVRLIQDFLRPITDSAASLILRNVCKL